MSDRAQDSPGDYYYKREKRESQSFRRECGEQNITEKDHFNVQIIWSDGKGHSNYRWNGTRYSTH